MVSQVFLDSIDLTFYHGEELAPMAPTINWPSAGCQIITKVPWVSGVQTGENLIEKVFDLMGERGEQHNCRSIGVCI